MTQRLIDLSGLLYNGVWSYKVKQPFFCNFL